MSRIDGILHDFLHHVSGPPSGFVTAAYEACERARRPVLLLRLLPTVELEAPFAQDTEILTRCQGLQQRFVEILGKGSRIPLADISGLMVEMKFDWDPYSAEKRRLEYAAVPAYYGYDPIYRCTVSLRLADGEERTRSKHNS